MKEVTFIRQNIDKWKELEKVVEKADKHTADTLADAYTEATADLAFSQSHFPSSRITIYLNNLASALHNEIYRNKREKWTRIFTFWSREMPVIIHDARKELLLSLLIFSISLLIGIFSTTVEGENFTRLILGDGYVDMTLENISKGHPMAVYSSSTSALSFFEIAFNNILVSFNCFASGMLTSIFSGLLIFYNGVMVGTFQTFMFQHHVGWISMLSIWLHGTLEISAIIIAGGAGITLGNGWLFPGTYSRLESFKRSAKRGMKIVIGTVPLFLIAGFVEGFITGDEKVPELLRIFFILLSLSFVIYYYIYLPNKKRNGLSKTQN